jgi:hypothetical protein
MPQLLEKGGPLSYGRIFSEWKEDVVMAGNVVSVVAYRIHFPTST